MIRHFMVRKADMWSLTGDKKDVKGFMGEIYEQ